jgi:hypothetical protein
MLLRGCSETQLSNCSVSDRSLGLPPPSPIGALSDTRLKLLGDLYDRNAQEPDRCLYRTHYSSAPSVIGLQIRLEPLTSLHASLQGSVFDHIDRLFISISNAWATASSGPNDFRELIREFYCLSEFFQNSNGLDLGILRTGERCSDCVLPAWASSWFEFTDLHRQALESDHVRAKCPIGST